MSVIIMKQTPIGRRAYAITKAEADAMVAEGRAVQDAAHAGIYEEITKDEIAQGYMTRNMSPLIDMRGEKRRVGRSPKVARVEEASDEA